MSPTHPDLVHAALQPRPRPSLVVQDEPQIGHEDHQARPVPAVTEASVDAAKLAQQRERAEVARVIGRPILDDGTIVTALPELFFESAGRFVEDGLDVTHCCNRHEWASVKVPSGKGHEEPFCELCKAETVYIDGYARYRDLLAKRRDGVV